jgi:hypothetical protein
VFAYAGTVTLTHSTIADNLASGGLGSGGKGTGGGGYGGGVFTFASISGGTVSLRNSLVAGNTAALATIAGPSFDHKPIVDPVVAATGDGLVRHGQDVFGPFASQGHNLIGIGDGGTGFADQANGNQVGAIGNPIDPRLDTALRDNGGPTPTLALLAGSPAIDAGDNVGAPPIDQRGLVRPVDGNKHGGGVVDIGAFEFSSVLIVTTTTLSGPSTAVAGQSLTFTASIAALVPGQNAPVGGAVVFTIDGKDQPGVPVDQSQVTLVLTAGLAAGPHTISVRYTGDKGHNNSVSSPLLLTVSPAATLPPVVSPRTSNVSGEVSIKPIALAGHYSRLWKRLVLRNHGTTMLQGPLYLVVGGLPKGVQLKHATGSTRAHGHLGDPFVLLPLKRLAPGQALTLDLFFVNPLKVPLHFNTAVLAGPGIV